MRSFSSNSPLMVKTSYLSESVHVIILHLFGNRLKSSDIECIMEEDLSKKNCRLILVDDHQMFLDGLESILSSQSEFQIVATAKNGRQALQEIEQHKPDVVLTDLNMPEMDGLELVKLIKSKFPTIKILVLSMLKDRETVGAIMDAEAEGFILKNSNKADLITAIKAVFNGETYYSNEIMSIMLTKYQKKVKQEEAKQLLTSRELEILQMIAQEHTSEKIANQLFLSIRTVETHRKNILAKTESTTIIGLLKYAVRNDLVILK